MDKNKEKKERITEGKRNKQWDLRGFTWDSKQEQQASGSCYCCGTCTRLGLTTPAREVHMVITRTERVWWDCRDRIKDWTLSGWRDYWRLSRVDTELGYSSQKKGFSRKVLKRTIWEVFPTSQKVLKDLRRIEKDWEGFFPTSKNSLEWTAWERNFPSSSWITVVQGLTRSMGLKCVVHEYFEVKTNKIQNNSNLIPRKQKQKTKKLKPPITNGKQKLLGLLHPFIKHINDGLEPNSWLVGSRSHSKDPLAIVLWICNSPLALLLFSQFFLF